MTPFSISLSLLIFVVIVLLLGGCSIHADEAALKDACVDGNTNACSAYSTHAAARTRAANGLLLTSAIIGGYQ